MNGFLTDERHNGEEKIVVSIDIGTTYSAVAFTYLEPGQHSRVRTVTNWPGEDDPSLSKTSTIAAYRGQMGKAWGPDAMGCVREKRCSLTEWFKLHLHPPSISPTSSFEVPKLPRNVSLEQVYADFMEYLLKNTKTAFEQQIPDGPAIWERLTHSATTIVTIPNGWDFVQQDFPRQAAVKAGLVRDSHKYSLLEFVSEGEASVHWVLTYNPGRWMARGDLFAVVDAGGSTIDSTLYRCVETHPTLKLSEVCPSACVQAGGVYVDRAAESLFRRKFQSSGGSVDEEAMRDMVEAFRNRAKLRFDGTQPETQVKFGGPDNRNLGIERGRFSLTNEEMRGIFESTVPQIIGNCRALLEGYDVKYIILAGGFGESPYLQTRIRQEFCPRGIELVCPGGHSNKAAAEGALLWCLNHSVIERVARVTVGMEATPHYDGRDPEHVIRDLNERTFEDLDGVKKVLGEFVPLIKRGESIDDDYLHRQPFSILRPPTDDLTDCVYSLYVWEGEGTPAWLEDTEGKPLLKMRQLAVLRINMARVKHLFVKENGPEGQSTVARFDVVLKFKGTELRVFLQAKEEGILCESEIFLIPHAYQVRRD